jgi:hypothetical protein
MTTAEHGVKDAGSDGGALRLWTTQRTHCVAQQ